jgi:hypothetical protein
VQADWDWCHACGWDPDAKLPVAAPTDAHPEVLKSELVPGPGGAPTAAGGTPGAPRNGPTRVRAGTGSPGGGYAPTPNRTVPIVAGAGALAVLVVVLALVVFGRGEEPAVTTADRSTPGTLATTTTLAVAAWALPEGGLTVDLPAPLAPVPPPAVAAPFVEAVAYGGTADGRTYLVARMAVHPAYEWEDLGRAMIDAEDVLGAHTGFSVVARSSGAFDEMSSNTFSVVDARGPAESEADYQARREGEPTGEGIALVRGNDLYVVLVRGTSVRQAQFSQIRDSIVVSQTGT